MPKPNSFLFEISWEVCNQVGGIYTVLKTKAEEVKQQFKDNYICIGPLHEKPTEFIDLTGVEEWTKIKTILDELDCQYKYGYWDIPGKPKVILLSFEEFQHKNELLHKYWEVYQLDTYHAGSDIVHPIVFSSLCAQFISAYKNELAKEQNIIVHAHEWMTGCSILHLNMHNIAVSTVFTTHATVTGRSFASHEGHLNFKQSSASQIAEKYHVQIKHNIEKLSALQTNCFSCVSDALALECEILLGRKPDVVVRNGINCSYFQSHHKTKKQKQVFKKTLLKKLKGMFNQTFPNDTQLWISSGRYEIENKGFDTLIASLDNLNNHLKELEHNKPVILILCPAVISQGITKNTDKHSLKPGIVNTHSFLNIKEDQLLQKLYQSNIHHDPNRKVFIVYSPELLQGSDGFYNISYYSLLSYMDLSIFPSLYEPWGYTPHESIACAVPTISSDTSGFGHWVKDNENTPNIGIITRSMDAHTSYASLCNQIKHYYHYLLVTTHRKQLESLNKITKLSDWSLFYKNYNKAYTFAQTKQELINVYTKNNNNQSLQSFTEEQETSEKEQIQEELKQLNLWFENWWWSYNPEATSLFEQLNEKLYKHYKQNPYKFIELLNPSTLSIKLKETEFKKQFQSIKEQYKKQCLIDETKLPKDLKPEHPIVYFSMEFGIDEQLPIYSGGLGILAGDTLKAASDMHIPMYGFGLMYRMGYFTQKISQTGQQNVQSHYLCDENLKSLKLKKVLSEKDLIKVHLFNEPVYLQCWTLQIGRSHLYLLDSDIIQNKTYNRSLTHKLYPTDRVQRLKQEVLLGYGSIKLLNKLNIKPSLYHLNEGHCAFVIFERLIQLREKQLPLLECIDKIKENTVFTTHTSVPAGIERFETNLVKEMLADTWEKAQVCGNDCINWGLAPNDNLFSLTVLAFRFSNEYNGVSELHAKLANEIWESLNRVRKNKIKAVTNGVHPGTWIGRHIRGYYKNINTEKELEFDNQKASDLWSAHKKQKNALLNYTKEEIKTQFSRRNETHQHLLKCLESIENNPDYLTIGFARRFATYKQADLILENLTWLTKIIKKGVRIIFAGKAHPADIEGQAIAQRIYHASKISELQGNIILLENYNMALGKLMVQGVDLWLNNPIYGQEASGTSGMKAALNGVLNLSVKDGWWNEGYEKDLGFKIEAQLQYPNIEDLKKDYSTHLYTVLEQKIIPTYYERNKENLPIKWIQKMHNSMLKHSKRFSTNRMMNDYYEKLYLPTMQKKTKQRKYQIN